MSEQTPQARLTALEIRYSHQEAALETLTGTVLQQAQQLADQADAIERLERALRALQSGLPAAPTQETPPHY